MPKEVGVILFVLFSMPATVFRIHIHWILIPTRGFYDQKWREKNYIAKNVKFFMIKNRIIYFFRPPWRSSKLEKKPPPAIQREHPTLQNLKVLSCFLIQWVILACLDPDLIRIRIGNAGQLHQYSSSSFIYTMIGIRDYINIHQMPYVIGLLHRI